MTAAMTDHSLDLNVLSWALAVEKASRAASTQPPAETLPDPLAALTDDQRQALEAELRSAGLTDDDGALTPDWQQTLTRAAEAPLTLELVARSSGVSVHCDVSLAGGSGLARTSSRTVRELPDGTVTTETVGERMAVTAFSEESLWAVVSAALPDVPELTSTAMPSVDREERLPVTASELAAVNAATRATVQLSVAAGRQIATGIPDPGSPLYRSVHLWLLTDRLFEVRTTPARQVDGSGDGQGGAGAAPEGRPGVVLIPQEPGTLARQLVWDVLGAQQFLSSAAEGGARS
ncbi:hypothetical protein [Arthrobacter sp. RCC_34]|uniref:hypothetical protein n=1 Tax=Arthrobacter sp. RCC_34 TaxID=3239230 RepID=UPI0035262CE3